jgi:hypothetical protein
MEYDLYDEYYLNNAECFIHFDEFTSLVETYCLFDQISEEHFESWMWNTGTRWNTMDRNGNFFGGFWAYPRESNEYKNAYRLTFKDNLNALLELPFPRNLIAKLLIVEIENNTSYRRFGQSVKSIVMFCWWIDKMIRQLNMLDTLTDHIIYEMNCLHLPISASSYRDFEHQKEKEEEFEIERLEYL